MWKTLRCEVRGSMTSATAPLQDKIVVSNDLNVNVLCLSCGTTMSKVSHFGSSIVTQKAAEFITINFDEIFEQTELEVKESLITYILSSLKRQASLMSVTVDELAANLMLIAVKNNKYVSFCLGEGMIGYYHENNMEVLFSGRYESFITSRDAMLDLEVKKGLVKGVKGFTVMSTGTAQILHSAGEGDFLEALCGVITSTNSITEEELETNLQNVFDEYVIRKTSSDCSIAILAEYRSLGRYYELSLEEKIMYFKFSKYDENSIDRVKELDNILQLITTEKSIEDLSKVLNVKAIYLKTKMDILVESNLLSLSTGNIYKKIS